MTGKLGLSCSFANFDYGIDVTVNNLSRYKGRIFESEYKLDIQAKSSINATIMDGEVHYALKVDAYDKLRVKKCPTPRILVLLLLPREEDEWVHQDEDRLMMRKCAYWVSLKGRPPVENETSVTITIPRVNRFTVDGLREIMSKVKQGVRL